MTLRCALLIASTCGPLLAQAPIGSVKTDGNNIAGMVTVSNGRAVLTNSGAITAGPQAADVALTRGGTVRVCSGSTVHLSQPAMQVARPPMLLALDRGATEIRVKAEKTDSVITPDLRIELSNAAPLDLRVRVVPNGDTCVDNNGKDAPTLHITEVFGDAAYFVRPGQRVLFEHGHLREVVDNETSSCGCPRNGETLVLAGKGKAGDGKLTPAAKANPFPEAVSQGLQPAEVPQAPPGESHVQVSAALKYDGTTNTATGPPGTDAVDPAAATGEVVAVGGQTPSNSAATRASSTANVVVTDVHVASTAPPPSGPNPFRAIGRFFKRIFGAN